jgi:hypothetical protein
MVRVLEALPARFEVCYETCCGYGHYHDLLSPIAAQVTVAHPGRLRLIFRSKGKNDRKDAERLAKLRYLGEAPAVRAAQRRGQRDAHREGTAAGIAIRHDHGCACMCDDFQQELTFLGRTSSPRFVREPERNGVAERLIRTLKENLLRGPAPRQGSRPDRGPPRVQTTYNERCLI